MSKDKCWYNLDDLVEDACESFDNDYNRNNYDDDDTIHEIADNSVPIYYYDIGQYAAHNSWLMTEKPESCPGGDAGNAHDQIQANIYEYVLNGLYEHKQESEDD